MSSNASNSYVPTRLHAALFATLLGVVSMGPGVAAASTVHPAPADSPRGVVHVDPDAHADDAAAARLVARGTKDTSHRMTSAERDTDADDWSGMNRSASRRKGAIGDFTGHSTAG